MAGGSLPRDIGLSLAPDTVRVSVHYRNQFLEGEAPLEAGRARHASTGGYYPLTVRDAKEIVFFLFLPFFFFFKECLLKAPWEGKITPDRAGNKFFFFLFFF